MYYELGFQRPSSLNFQSIQADAIFPGEVTGTIGENPSQEVYYNFINPLVVGGGWGHHLFTGLKYSGTSGRCRPSFPVVQFIGLQYSV